jgi:hypothetical protein
LLTKFRLDSKAALAYLVAAAASSIQLDHLDGLAGTSRQLSDHASRLDRPGGVEAMLLGIFVALRRASAGAIIRQTLCPRMAGDRHGFPLRFDVA